MVGLQGNYDSGSSYDSYQRFSNMHDDMKASRSLPPAQDGRGEPGYGGRPHDPYRFTRSTAQPLHSPERELPPRNSG